MLTQSAGEKVGWRGGRVPDHTSQQLKQSYHHVMIVYDCPEHHFKCPSSGKREQVYDLTLESK